MKIGCSKYTQIMIDLLPLISFGFITFILGTLWALWVLYIAMMNIKRVADTQPLPWQARIIAYPTMAVFEIVELIANVVVCTILFLDFPKEIRVSDRLRRYWRDPKRYTWRLHIVRFLKPMLDPFDPAGQHI